MRNKIKEQAQRLTNLETYKCILENRIKQFHSSHQFPVTENDLKAGVPNTDQKIKNLNIHYLNIIEQKDKEIQNLAKKVESLDSKCKQYAESVEKTQFVYNCKSHSHQTKSINLHSLNEFPTLDKINSSDQLTELYSKLQSYFKDILVEKEQILESLRLETINNEEQRNYIEILRQTIESSIMKNGIGPLLQSIRNSSINNNNNSLNASRDNYYKNLNDIDILVDIAKLKTDSDKYRKELVMAQVLIAELRQEIEYLKKTNEDMNIKKERIRESLDKGILELDQAKNKVKVLEKEKDEIVNNFDDLKLHTQKSRNENEDLKTKINRLEQNVDNLTKINEDLSAALDNQTLLQAKLNDYKASFEKLYSDFDKLSKDKVNVETDAAVLKDEVEEKRFELARVKNVLVEKEERHDKEKKNLQGELENLSRNNKKLERYVNELNNNIKEKEGLIQKIEDKYILAENTNSALKSKNEELDDYKRNTEKKLDLTERTLKDLQTHVNSLKSTIQDNNGEKENLYNEFLNIKTEFEKLSLEYVKMNKDLENKSRGFNKLTDQHDTLLKENKNLEDNINHLLIEKENLVKDLRNLREKYDKDNQSKLNEINALNSDLTSIKKEYNNLKIKLNEFKNINDSLEEEIEMYKEKLQLKEQVLSKEKDEAVRELNLKSNRLDDIAKDRRNLENELFEKEKVILNDINEINSLNAQLAANQNALEETRLRYEKISADLQKEIKNNYDYNTRNRELYNKIEELKTQIDYLQDEKEKVEISRKRIYEELDSIKKLDKDTQIKNYTITNNFVEVKISVENIHTLVKSFVNRVTREMNDKERGIFTKNFVENVSDFNETNEGENILDMLKNIEDFSRVAFTEIEMLYDNTKNNNGLLKTFSERIKILENELHAFNLNEEERMVTERKMNMTLKELNEENKTLVYEKDDYEKMYEKAAKDIKSFKYENKKLIEELNNFKEELNSLASTYEELGRENREKCHLLNNASFQIEALEERIVILVKEKKYLETLIMRVSKCHPSREMHKIVNEIMNLNDSIAQMERDKIKAENSIYQIDDTSNEQSKKEKESLKNVVYDYERKMNEKREQQRNLENDMKTIEVNEKRMNELLYEYELKNKQLHKELSETKDEIRKNKMSVESRIIDNDNSLIDSQKYRNIFSKNETSIPTIVSAHNKNRNINTYDSFKMDLSNAENNHNNTKIDTLPSQDYGYSQRQTNSYIKEEKRNLSPLLSSNNTYKKSNRSRTYNNSNLMSSSDNY